jgi:hypothetical protein
MNLFPPTNTPSPAQVNAALLILRIASALAFLYHGSAILFGAFGGPPLRNLPPSCTCRSWSGTWWGWDSLPAGWRF